MFRFAIDKKEGTKVLKGTRLALLVAFVVVTAGAYFVLRSLQEGLKQEAGIRATVVFQSKRIEKAGTCGTNGHLRGLGIYRLFSGLGGQVVRMESLESTSDSLIDRVYLATLQGKRILITGVTDKRLIDLPGIDGQVKINGGGYSAGELELDTAKVMEILHYVYPSINASIKEFDWKHNTCVVDLS